MSKQVELTNLRFTFNGKNGMWSLELNIAALNVYRRINTMTCGPSNYAAIPQRLSLR